MAEVVVLRQSAPFRWDAERGLLVYDGSGDPDPNWKWIPEKGGYEPVDPPSGDRVFDRRLGAWVNVSQVEN